MLICDKKKGATVEIQETTANVAAAKEISVDSVVVAVLSKLDGLY